MKKVLPVIFALSLCFGLKAMQTGLGLKDYMSQAFLNDLKVMESVQELERHLREIKKLGDKADFMDGIYLTGLGVKIENILAEKKKEQPAVTQRPVVPVVQTRQVMLTPEEEEWFAREAEEMRKKREVEFELTEEEKKWIKEDRKLEEERKKLEEQIIADVMRFSLEEEKRKYEKKFFIGGDFVAANENKINGTNIFQPKVWNQFDGLGAAVCGYLAGIYASLVVKADFNRLPGKSLEEQLLDFDGIRTTLRRLEPAVFTYRLEKKLSEYLNIRFRRALIDARQVPDLPSHSPFVKGQLSILYENMLRPLATKIANEVVSDRRHFSFSQDGAKFLKGVIEGRQMEQGEINKYYKFAVPNKNIGRLRSYVFDKEVMQNFIDFDQLGDLAFDLAALETGIWKNLLGTIQTDWLNGAEIKIIWRILNAPNCELLVYDETDSIGTEFDANKDQMKKVARKIAEGRTLDVVFILGTMKRFGRVLGGTMGHWFALVRSHAGFYVVMDSGHNRNRLNDLGVKKVITSFESLVKKFKRRNG